MSEPATELTLTRTFNAPRDLVFRAWTDPELLSQWWGPNGVTTPVCEVDAVIGGKLNIVMLAGEESSSDGWSRVANDGCLPRNYTS